MGRLVQQGELPEDNLASLIFKLEHNVRVEHAGPLLKAMANHVARSEDGQELLRILGAWVRHIILSRALPERITLPDTEELSELADMTLAYSRDWSLLPRMEGRQEGRLEGQVELLSRQLARKFGPLSALTQQRIADANLDELERWSLNLLEAQTLEQVFS